MIIKNNISLKPYNTFGIDVLAHKFITITTVEELKEVLKTQQDFFILSGGSNMLLTKDIEKTVLYIAIKGIEIINQTNEYVFIKAMAGENWHSFVMFCIDNHFGGVENLSLIPGNVGTTPIQNIGAYGVEIKDVLHSCEALNIKTGKIEIFTNEKCKFNYRESVFKNELKNQYIITSVVYKLTKNNHNINIDYGAITSELENKNIKNPTIKDVSNAVIAIRESKLPNPKEIGNSGSFFKNAIIPKEKLIKLKEKYPEMPYYEISSTEVKIPTGWLIEKAGFKGMRIGDAGVHKNQALVLVNYANASGGEIANLANKIQNTIRNEFDIDIEAEVNIF